MYFIGIMRLHLDTEVANSTSISMSSWRYLKTDCQKIIDTDSG